MLVYDHESLLRGHKYEAVCELIRFESLLLGLDLHFTHGREGYLAFIDLALNGIAVQFAPVLTVGTCLSCLHAGR